MPAKKSPLSRTSVIKGGKSGVPRKLHVTYIFGRQGGEEEEEMFRDDDSGEKIQRSFRPTITSTMMMSMK